LGGGGVPGFNVVRGSIPNGGGGETQIESTKSMKRYGGSSPKTPLSQFRKTKINPKPRNDYHEATPHEEKSKRHAIRRSFTKRPEYPKRRSGRGRTTTVWEKSTAAEVPLLPESETPIEPEKKKLKP